MAATESLSRSPFTVDHLAPTSLPKSLSIMPTPPHPDKEPSSDAPEPMDITPTNSMPPPAGGSPSSDKQSDTKTLNGELGNTSPPTSSNSNGNPPIGASAGSQPTKVVQTAFIHKLYNMLEDQSIQHLISWSSTGESFVMSPSTEFSKVLAQYFKHTNISSFVRQLNMYGFHKVSDVFHTGAPDSTLWEFKHGNGNFKRGDLIGLREIKRRASRHTLIHRDSFSSGAKSLAPTQPISQTHGAPDSMPDPVETRLNILEHNYFDMHARLARSEDSNMYLTNKCHMLFDGLLKCHQWNQDLATYLTSVVPDQESQIHRDISLMQREIARHIDHLRNAEAENERRPSISQPPMPYTPNHLQESGPPLSPRQIPVSDLNQRRPSHPSIFELRTPQAPTFRHHVAPHLSISPRRYGSIGSNNSYSPSAGRAPAPPPPPPTAQAPHPLATVSSPPSNLSRRHTSADIRLHGWEGGPATSLPAPGGPGYSTSQAPTHWPSSPARPPQAAGDQAIREAFANYEISRGPSSSNNGNNSNAGRHTPPPPHVAPHDNISSIAGTGPDSAWAVPGSRFPGYGKAFGGPGSALNDSGGPPTRRSSMASNLHGLLNPAADGADEDGSGDGGGPGKRKRVV